MKLALDSNVVIDLINDDQPAVRAAFSQARSEGCTMIAAPQAVHEVAYGALISARPLQQAEALHEVTALLEVSPFTTAHAQRAAALRAERRRRGRAMAAVDAMIAAHALAEDCPLVTADADDFADIPGLAVINWRAVAAP